MTDPDEKTLTEIEVEIKQRQRLMDVFSLVETYDGREAVITFCETQVNSQRDE